MNIREQIIADITAKVETKLASQKVELSLDQDANKLLASYFSATDTINSKYRGVASEIRGLISSIDEAVKTVNNMPVLISKFQQVAKEIGIDLNNIEEIRDMETAIKDVTKYKELSKKLNSLVN